MASISWNEVGEKYEEIRYHKAEGIAKITINRPKRRNAFTPLTVDEMRDALDDARMDTEIGVIVLTGEGEKAFCSGGDQGVRGALRRKRAVEIDRSLSTTCPSKKLSGPPSPSCHTILLQSRPTRQIQRHFRRVVVEMPRGSRW